MNVLLLSPYIELKKGPMVWAKNFAQRLYEYEDEEMNLNLYVLTFDEKNVLLDGIYTGTSIFNHTGFYLERRLIKYPYISLIEKIIRIERSCSVDIVQTNDVIMAFIALICKKITHVPVVLRVGGEYFNEINEQSERNCLHIFRKRVPIISFNIKKLLESIGLYTLKRVDTLISVNAHIKEYLDSYGFSSHVIPNAVDTKTYSILPLKKGISLKKGSLLTISNMSVFKKVEGIGNLLDGFSILKRNFPEIQLYIVGDGPYRDHLENYTSNLNLSENVTFLGYRNDAPTLLNECSIYVHSSLQDVFPNVILEAMASKKPIAATKVGGISEIINDKFNGLLCNCNPEDISSSIELLLNNADLRESIANNAYLTVSEKYNWNTVINSYISIYKKILQDY
ncbi:MAG: glycosyltransferase family 4 protein [Methanosarcina sp.]